MSEIETLIEPPVTEPGEGDGGGPSTRLVVSVLGPDDTCREAAVQLFDAAAGDPQQLADALLRAALAAANLAGPEVGWAAMQRFARYDGRITGA